jgi:hypothetical protein
VPLKSFASRNDLHFQTWASHKIHFRWQRFVKRLYKLVLVHEQFLTSSINKTSA